MTKHSDHNKMFLDDIRFILKDLLKVIKVVSLYPEDNPLPQSLKQSFSEKLVSIVQELGELPIAVEKDALLYQGEVVYQDRSKEEALAGIFFGTGLTDFCMKDGMEVQDVYKLLDAIKLYLNCNDKSLDLAALLWEAEIVGFSFQTIEDIALSKYDESFNLQEYINSSGSTGGSLAPLDDEEMAGYHLIFSGQVEINEIDLNEFPDEVPPKDRGSIPKGGGTLPKGYTRIPAYQNPSDNLIDETPEEAKVNKTAEAAAAMGFGASPDTDASIDSDSTSNATLILNDEYALTADEEAEIKRLVDEDATFDAYESTSELLKELLLQESEMDSFYETVLIAEKVLTEFVAGGKLDSAGSLLAFFNQLEDVIRKDKPLWAERLKDAYITAGSRERLTVLAESLNQHETIGSDLMSAYLDNFGWEALSGISELMGELEHRHHRQALVEYLTERGRDNIPIVSAGVYDKRWFVVRNSAIVLARIGNNQALGHLAKAVGHDDDRVRLAVAIALKDCRDESTLELLGRLAIDTEPRVRKEAIESIIARGNTRAFNTIADILNNEHFVDLDQTDQQVLLNAFSTLGNEHAVPYLVQLITRFNVIHNPTIGFFRIAAYEALTINGSQQSQEALLKLSSSMRPGIRNHARRALNNRRDRIYGDSE